MMNMKESAKVGFGIAIGFTLFRVAVFGVAIAAGMLLGSNNR